MIRTITTDQVKANVDELLSSPRDTGDVVIVEADGEPLVVLISPAEYEQLSSVWQRGWAAVDRIGRLNAHEDPDDVLEFVTAIVEEVREERYHSRQQRDHSSR